MSKSAVLGTFFLRTAAFYFEEKKKKKDNIPKTMRVQLSALNSGKIMITFQS